MTERQHKLHTNSVPGQYSFALRGESINPMIDAATPLLGMTQRLRDITNLDNAGQLYHQVVADIQAVERILEDKGYDSGTVLSFRYILCTFIDELAMQHPWSSQNTWGTHSLLVRFHNETWGGERTFILLERLMKEPERYKDLLEFVYLCFCLGFRGRYKVVKNHSEEEFNRIFRRLYHHIASVGEESVGTVVYHYGVPKKSGYRLRNRISIKKMFLFSVLGLFVIYGLYALNLRTQSQDILEQLSRLLHG
ncbi:DotU family type IV/VI secretion system protein [Metakosakonia massiliensis]|uniref:Type IV / VI secretion system DotU domain-containing protein n=1 Tax=Phytobacter massiliensis TaxID=1485952 RepID=A0A6N3AGB7_9ENTR